MELFTRKEVIARLRKVASGDFSDVTYRFFGLCAYTLDESVDGSIEYDEGVEHQDTFYPLLFAKWPECSGSIVFPVGNGYEDWVGGDFGAYNLEKDMWVGELGAARLRLATFLADELEKMD